jgi:ABC-type transport system substrate-binding protein
VAAKWKGIGVDAKVESGGTTASYGTCSSRALTRRRCSPTRQTSTRITLQPGTAARTGPSGRNISLLSDAADRLLEEARATANQARRADLYRQFQELFAQEVPALPLFSSTSSMCRRSR